MWPKVMLVMLISTLLNNNRFSCGTFAYPKFDMERDIVLMLDIYTYDFFADDAIKFMDGFVVAEDKVRFAVFGTEETTHFICSLSGNETYVKNAITSFRVPLRSDMTGHTMYGDGVRKASAMLKTHGRHGVAKSIYWFISNDTWTSDADQARDPMNKLKFNNTEFLFCFYGPYDDSVLGNIKWMRQQTDWSDLDFTCQNGTRPTEPPSEMLTAYLWEKACGNFNGTCAPDPKIGSICLQYLWPTKQNYSRDTCLSIPRFQGKPCQNRDCEAFCEQNWKWEDVCDKCGTVTVKRKGSPMKMFENELKQCPQSKTHTCAACPSNVPATSPGSTGQSKTTIWIIIAVMVLLVLLMLVIIICVVVRKRKAKKKMRPPVTQFGPAMVKKAEVKKSRGVRTDSVDALQMKEAEHSMGVSIRDRDAIQKNTLKFEKTTGSKKAKKVAPVQKAGTNASANKAMFKSAKSNMKKYSTGRKSIRNH